MLLTRRAALGVLGVTALTAASGCEEPEPEVQPEALIEVGGDFATSPRLRFTAPLDITETSTEVIIAGEGAEVVAGSAVMLSYHAVDAVTGETLETNFYTSPDILLLTEEDTGPLYDELLGRAEGTRLLRLELGTDTRPNPTVIVIDIRHTEAWGVEVDLPEGAPELRVGEDGEPMVIVPESEPPAGLQVWQVLRGDGPQVRPGQAVTVRYTTVSWSTGEVADTLWGEGLMPTTIPFTGLIPAWQNGLVDEQAGSRVVLITPPEQAFGTDNLVFIIDVLAVSHIETDGENGTEDDGGGDDGEEGTE